MSKVFKITTRIMVLLACTLGAYAAIFKGYEASIGNLTALVFLSIGLHALNDLSEEVTTNE